MLARFVFAAGLLVAGTGLARADGDAAEGAKVFKKCSVCHVVDKPQNRVGPSLLGVIGRPAGTVEGFKYSEAMKGSGIVWSAETLDAYIADPKGYIPGNKMAFAGLKKPEERADVIAYIIEASAPK
ncbi:MAG: cytochrome c family protein [Geminicoccaceae bacterium]